MIVVGENYHSETVKYFNSLSAKPSKVRQRSYDNMIRSLIAAGFWSGMDRLGIFAAEIQASGLIDVRDPTKACTAENSITWTADRGYTGDAISMYVRIGEAFGSAGSNYVLNDAMVGVWVNLQGAGAGLKPALGVVGGDRPKINPSTGSSGTGCINSTSGTSIPTGAATRTGFWTMERTASNAVEIFRNGISQNTNTTASTTLNTQDGALLRLASTYSNDRVGLFCAGKSLGGATNQLAFYNILNTFMTDIGAN